MAGENGGNATWLHLTKEQAENKPTATELKAILADKQGQLDSVLCHGYPPTSDN